MSKPTKKFFKFIDALGGPRKASEILKIHEATISRWKTGKRNPSVKHYPILIKKGKGHITLSDIVGIK